MTTMYLSIYPRRPASPRQPRELPSVPSGSGPPVNALSALSVASAGCTMAAPRHHHGVTTRQGEATAMAHSPGVLMLTWEPS